MYGFPRSSSSSMAVIVPDPRVECRTRVPASHPARHASHCLQAAVD
jgi:hypothetical protein